MRISTAGKHIGIIKVNQFENLENIFHIIDQIKVSMLQL